MIAAVALCIFIPETKGKSLEEIEGLFEKPLDGLGSEEEMVPSNT